MLDGWAYVPTIKYGILKLVKNKSNNKLIFVLMIYVQVGFTLPANRGRSCRYVTDLAKSIAVPVIHVNGDHPEVSN